MRELAWALRDDDTIADDGGDREVPIPRYMVHSDDPNGTTDDPSKALRFPKSPVLTEHGHRLGCFVEWCCFSEVLLMREDGGEWREIDPVALFSTVEASV